MNYPSKMAINMLGILCGRDPGSLVLSEDLGNKIKMG